MQNLLLVGGDRRMLHLAEMLEKEGWTVETMGLRDGDMEKVHMDRADAVLFPYPFSVMDGRVPVLKGEKLKPDAVLDRLPCGIPLLAGRGMEGYAEQDSFCLKRYTDAAAFDTRNAELSAEAAVCESMLHSHLALMDTKVLVTGYGLFGRALALKLKALGAEVWIAARREKQRMQAAAEGMKTVSIIDMTDVLPEMNLILNTIPARIFSEYHLKQLSKECQVLELASSPYGFDMDTARAMGVSCAALPGLPARYSPVSAAKALHEAVSELIGRYSK